MGIAQIPIPIEAFQQTSPAAGLRAILAVPYPEVDKIIDYAEETSDLRLYD